MKLLLGVAHYLYKSLDSAAHKPVREADGDTSSPQRKLWVRSLKQFSLAPEGRYKMSRTFTNLIKHEIDYDERYIWD